MEERFPIQFLKEASKFIHHSAKDEDELNSELLLILKNKFYVGEKVEILSSNTDAKNSTGIIIGYSDDSLSSNKENPSSYSYNIKISDKLYQENVPFSKLRRLSKILDSDIKNLINTLANRISKSAPWKLNDEYRQKYGIKNKVFPLFANKSPQINPIILLTTENNVIPRNSKLGMTTPNSTINKLERIDECIKKAGSWVAEVTVGPMPDFDEFIRKKPVQLAPAIPSDDEGQLIDEESNKDKKKKQKNDLAKMDKKKNKIDKEKDDKPTTSKKSRKTDGEGQPKKKRMHTSEQLGEPRKKKQKLTQEQKEAKNKNFKDVIHKVIVEAFEKDQKAKKQKTLNSFFPSATNAGASNSALPGQMEQSKADSLVDLAKKYLRTMDSSGFEKFLEKNCELPNDFIRLIPSKFLQYALRHQGQQKKNKDAMKHMSAEEKRNFSKEQSIKSENVKYETLRKGFMNGKFEDTLIKSDLNEISLVEGVSDNLEEMQLFSVCLEISEFFQLFCNFFSSPKKSNLFTAFDIYQALHDKQRAYFIFGHLFIDLLRILSQENMGKMVAFKGFPLRDYHVNLGSLPEIIKQIFVQAFSQTSNIAELYGSKKSNSIFSSSLDEEMHEVFGKLKQTDLYDLDCKSLIMIVQFFIQEIRGLDSFQDFIEEFRDTIAKDKEKLKFYECEIDRINTKLNELPPSKSEEEMATLSRQDSIHHIKINKNRHQLEIDLSVNEQKHEAKENSIKTRQRLLKGMMRVVPLGYDRLHRRYWYFYNSLNTGIYVEQGWYTEDDYVEYMNSSDESDNKSVAEIERDVLVIMLQQILNFSAPTNLPIHWRRISTKDELCSFINTLAEKGVRESVLRKKILEVQDEINRSFDAPRKALVYSVDMDDDVFTTEDSINEIIEYKSRLRSATN